MSTAPFHSFLRSASPPRPSGSDRSEDTVLASGWGVEVVTRTPGLGEIDAAGVPRPGIVEL